MLARLFSNSPQPQAASDAHPAWCSCLECATEWDAAHCGLRRYSGAIYAALLAAASLAGILWFVGVPA